MSNAESNRTVFVRPIGMVGHGKSTMLNGIAGYVVPHPKKLVFKQFFEAGSSTEGIGVNMDLKVSVNPDVLGKGESMILGDAEGIGSSADDSPLVFDRLLESLKKGKEPATLLVVSTFVRVEKSMIKLFRLLARCSSLSPDNCVLVLTRASDPDKDIDACDRDPSDWISNFRKKTELDCFVKDKNVFCIDHDDIEYRKVTTDRVRAALVTKMPVTVHTTYAELLNAANELDTSNGKARDIAQAQLDVMKSDLAWHERRMKDLAIAIASTGWIPFVGIVSTAGMAIAAADSEAKVKRFRQEIPVIEARVKDAEAAKAAAIEEAALIESYLA